MKKLLIRVTGLILSSIVVIGLVACGSNAADEVLDKDTDSFTESEEVATKTGWEALEAYLIENGEYESGNINSVRKGESYSLSIPMENSDELYLVICIPEDGDKWINVSFWGNRRNQYHYAEYYVDNNYFHDNCEPNKTCPIDPETITRNTFYSDFEVYDDESGDWVQLIDEADIKEENEIIISLFTYYDSFVREELGLTMSDFGFLKWDCE